MSDPEHTLFVGRLSFDTSEETVEAVFAQYGRIRSLRLVRDVLTGCSRGYAFVEFENRRDMQRAYRDAHRRMVDGREILVDIERERVSEGWTPRRLGALRWRCVWAPYLLSKGGGLGGRKESGQLRFGGRDRPFRR